MTTHLGAPQPRLTLAELLMRADQHTCAARLFMLLGDNASAMRALRGSLHYRQRITAELARALAPAPRERSRMARAR